MNHALARAVATTALLLALVETPEVAAQTAPTASPDRVVLSEPGERVSVTLRGQTDAFTDATVVDAGGRPVRGISVQLGRNSGRELPLIISHEGAAAGTYQLDLVHGRGTTRVRLAIVVEAANMAAALALADFRLDRAVAIVGDDVRGRIVLDAPAPRSGATVVLSSSDSRVVRIPASVTVPGGATSVEIVANVAGGSGRVDLVADLEGSRLTASFEIEVAATLFELFIEDEVLDGGGVTAGRVTLDREATTDIEVALQSSDPGAVRLPASVTIPSGRAAATFEVRAPTPAADLTATITATTDRGGLSEVVEVRRLPVPVAVDLAADSVTGGEALAATVVLDRAATRALALDVSDNAGWTAALEVPVGQAGIQFSVPTEEVSSQETRALVVSTADGSASVEAGFTVHPVAPQIVLASLELLSGEPVVTQGSAQMRVELVNPAPPGGVAIPVQSASEALIESGVVQIPAGATAGLLTLPVGPVLGQQEVLLTASLPGQEAMATVQLEGPALTGVRAVFSSSYEGALVAPANVTCRMDFSRPAGMPDQSVTVALTSSHPELFPVPEVFTYTVTQATGAIGMSCPVSVVPAETTEVTLTATLGDATFTHDFTVVVASLATAQIGNPRAGSGASLRVDLTAPAPDGGLPLELSSSRPDLAQVQGTFTVEEGDTRAFVPVAALPAELEGPESVTITVSDAKGAIDVTFDILPTYELTSLQILGASPPPVYYHGDEVRVSMNFAGAFVDRTVTLDASHPELLAGFEPTAVIPAATSAGLTWTIQDVGAPATITVTATAGGESREITIPVGRPSLSGISFYPLGLAAPGVDVSAPVTELALPDRPRCMVDFDFPEGRTPIRPDTLVVAVDRPDVLAVGETHVVYYGSLGGPSANLSCPVEGEVTEPTPVSITVSLGSESVTGTITLVPEPLARLAEWDVPVASLRPGETSTARITLDRPAHAAGVDIVISHDSDYLSVVGQARITYGETEAEIVLSIGSNAPIPEPRSVTLVATAGGESVSKVIEERPSFTFEGLSLVNAPDAYWPGDEVRVRLQFSGSGTMDRPVDLDVSDPTFLAQAVQDPILPPYVSEIQLTLAEFEEPGDLVLTAASLGATHQIAIPLEMPTLPPLEEVLFLASLDSPSALQSEVTYPTNLSCRFVFAPPARTVEGYLELSSSRPDLLEVESEVFVRVRANDEPISQTGQGCQLVGGVSEPTPVDVTATYQGASVTGTLTILPAPPTILNFTRAFAPGDGPSSISGPDPVVPGEPFYLRLELDRTAPVSGFSLGVESSRPDLIPAGSWPVAGERLAWVELIPQELAPSDPIPTPVEITVTSGEDARTYTAQVYPHVWLDRVGEALAAYTEDQSLTLMPTLAMRPYGRYGEVELPTGFEIEVSTSNPGALVGLPATVVPTSPGELIRVEAVVGDFEVDTDVEVTFTAEGRSVSTIVRLRKPLLESVSLSLENDFTGGDIVDVANGFDPSSAGGNGEPTFTCRPNFAPVSMAVGNTWMDFIEVTSDRPDLIRASGMVEVQMETEVRNNQPGRANQCELLVESVEVDTPVTITFSYAGQTRSATTILLAEPNR